MVVMAVKGLKFLAMDFRFRTPGKVLVIKMLQIGSGINQAKKKLYGTICSCIGWNERIFYKAILECPWTYVIKILITL